MPPGSGTSSDSLESRIVEIVREALDGAAISEVNRLEQELAGLRSELELARAEIALSSKAQTDAS